MTRQEALAAAKPILFSTPMVQAILREVNPKTMTRRVINPRYRDDESGFQVITRRNGEFVRVEKVDENECGIFSDGSERYVNPAYQSGDILWVRETWTTDPHGVDRLAIANGTMPVYYKADYSERDSKELFKGVWRPSIHMPREAARIFLRVTGVRVEKLCDMTVDDAVREGMHDGNGGAPLIEFSALWDSLNAKRGYGWDTNPWVWVYAFERLEAHP